MKDRVKCYNCKSTKTSIFQKINKIYSLYYCNSCLLILTYPQPTAIGKINKHIYDSNEELHSRVANFAVEYKRARKHVLKFMKYKKNGKYLDVGCSYGIGVRAAKDLGFDAMGVEPAKSAVEYARNNLQIKIIQNTLQNARLKSNTYDVVSLYDVLEHIPNLRAFLKEINRILKPNGILVVQSPNIKSYAYFLLQLSWNWLLVPNHLWHFSVKSLSKLLENTGFSIKSSMTEDNIYDFASNLKSKLFSYKMPVSFYEKAMQKTSYWILYGILLLGSPVWNLFEKGGSMQIYAIKK